MARNLRLRLAVACASAFLALCAHAIDTHGLRIGVALGSGSAHGLAHIGVIQELEANGLDVDVVAGTSAGALFGALWASGLTGMQIEGIAREADWLEANRLAFSWQGLYSSDPLQKELEKAFRGKAIETWPRRFAAVATNLGNGHRALLTSGSGALAVQASTAVPGYFRPIVVGGQKLADGALVEPVPVDAARALGADFVIAFDVAYRPYEESVSSAPQYTFQAMHILVNTLASQQLKSADVAIRLDLHRALLTGGREAVIAEGREAVRRAWPHIARELSRAAERRAGP
jgi:NTE family protein